MKIREFFKRLDKKTKLTMAGFALLGIALVPAAVMAGYGPNGPDRVIYDWNNPAQHNGAFDGPRFNSYINTDVYGDERAFVDAKECTVTGDACYNQSPGAYKDQQPVQVGKEYIVRAYVHNIANPSINDDPNKGPGVFDGIGVAQNTKIRFELPEGVANGFTAQARISADNAIPQTVYDTVDLRNDNQAFDVEFVPGSARIYNSAHQNGLALPDGIMSASGTLIGHDAMDGVFPGCFDFASFVVIRVRVNAPALEINKRVSKVDMPKLTDSSETITANRGETISWRIDYKNSGSAVIDNITIRDQLPAGLELVPGSIKLTSAAGTETLQDSALGSGGVDVGDYFPNGNGVIRFRTKIVTPDNVCELRNVAFGRAVNVPERSDDAKVVIADCVPTVVTFRCDLLTVNKIVDRKYGFSVKYTAQNGAQFKSVTYNFGDNTTPLTTDKTSVEHTYTNAGSYATKATVTFTVNGQDASVTSAECAKTINVDVTPTNLPSTGPGDVIGIFASVTVAGAVAHRYILSRRYNV
jgi:uncharacterized repeat protein (TIGR01451 family)